MEEKKLNKLEQLQKEIDSEKKSRIELVQKEINAILEKHNCNIITEMVWVEGNAPTFKKVIISL